MAMNAEITVFWDATQQSLADTYVPHYTAAQLHKP